MINIGQLRRAIGNAPKLAGIEGLNCFTYTPARAAPPMWYPGEVTFDRTAVGQATFGDTRGYVVQGTVITAAEADEQSGQDLLDEYLSEGSDKSIIDAIESDSALGQLCDDLHVQGVDGYRLYVFGQGNYFGARLRIFVIG